MSTSETLPGWLGVIDGPDGSGKTTQVTMAKEYAAQNNLDVLFTREPGGTPLGETLREVMLHNRDYKLSPEVEFGILFTGRLDAIDNLLRPKLELGGTAIVDRGPKSTDAYQGGGGGMSRALIKQIHELAFPSWYKEPNGSVVLSVSRETSRQRLMARSAFSGLDKIEEKDLAFFDRVFDVYKEYESSPNVTVVDGEQSPEDVFKLVRPVLFGPEHE